MKRWRILPLSVALAMTAITPMQTYAAQSPEFSRSSEEWDRLKDNVMEYGELEALVHEYNPVVLNNRLSYNTSDTKNKSSQEIADMLRDAARSARAAASEAVEQAGDGAMADVVSDSIEAQAKQLELQADNSNVDDKIIRLQYEMAEASVASGVQGLMIQYNQLLENRKVLEKGIELANASYNSAVTRQNIGSATQADVLSAKQQVQSLESQLISLDSGIQAVKQNLCIMTGWSYDANPEIQGIPEADMSRIDSMDLNIDIPKALENNYSLKISRRQLENTSSSYGDTEVMRKSIANNEQNLATAVTKQYQAVIDAKAAYEAAAAATEVETRNMNAADIKYQVGSIGRLEYIQQQSSYLSKEADKASKNMALFQAMETYNWMIRGLAAISQ